MVVQGAEQQRIGPCNSHWIKGTSPTYLSPISIWLQGQIWQILKEAVTRKRVTFFGTCKKGRKKGIAGHTHPSCQRKGNPKERSRLPNREGMKEIKGWKRNVEIRKHGITFSIHTLEVSCKGQIFKCSPTVTGSGLSKEFSSLRIQTHKEVMARQRRMELCMSTAPQ